MLKFLEQIRVSILFTVKNFNENFLDEGKFSIVHHFGTPAVYFRFKFGG